MPTASAYPLSCWCCSEETRLHCPIKDGILAERRIRFAMAVGFALQRPLGFIVSQTRLFQRGITLYSCMLQKPRFRKQHTAWQVPIIPPRTDRLLSEGIIITFTIYNYCYTISSWAMSTLSYANVPKVYMLLCQFSFFLYIFHWKRTYI